MKLLDASGLTVNGNHVIPHLNHICQKYNYNMKVLKLGFKDPSCELRVCSDRFHCILCIDDIKASAFGPNKKTARQLASYEMIKLLVKKNPNYKDISDNAYKTLMKVNVEDKVVDSKYDSTNYIAILDDKLMKRRSQVFVVEEAIYSFVELTSENVPTPSDEQLRTPLFQSLVVMRGGGDVGGRGLEAKGGEGGGGDEGNHRSAFVCRCRLNMGGVGGTTMNVKSWPLGNLKSAKKHAAYLMLNTIAGDQYKVEEDVPSEEIDDLSEMSLEKTIERFNNLDIKKEYQELNKYNYDSDLDSQIVCNLLDTSREYEMNASPELDSGEIYMSLHYCPNTINFDFQRT